MIHNVSDSFLDEGVDEQVLQELKQMWTTKMMASKAVDPEPERSEVPPPNVTKVTKITFISPPPVSQLSLNSFPPFQSGVLNKGGQKSAQANGAKSKAAQQRTAAATAAASQTNGTAAATTAATQSSASAASSASTAAGGGTSTTTQSSTGQNPLVSVLDPYKLIPIQITLPPQGEAESRVLTIQLPGSVIQNNQLGQMLTANVIQSIMNLPPAMASNVLQQHVNSTLQNNALQST